MGSAGLVNGILLDHDDLPVLVDIVAIVPLPLSTDFSNDWKQDQIKISLEGREGWNYLLFIS